MTRRDDIRDELKNLAPSLVRKDSFGGDKPVTNRFDVPENYFDALPNEM